MKTEVCCECKTSVTDVEAVCLHLLIETLSTKSHSSQKDKTRNTLVEGGAWKVEI